MSIRLSGGVKYHAYGAGDKVEKGMVMLDTSNLVLWERKQLVPNVDSSMLLPEKPLISLTSCSDQS